ncbi:MAG: hypothetical protein V4581_09260, partial [Bacteroidota bacterium]
SGTTYYVGQTVGSCSSTRVAVTATVTTATPPQAIEQTFCAGITVSALWLPGNNIKWYGTVGGPQLAGTTPVVSGTYYATQTLSGCESAATPITVTITTTPSVTGDQTQEFIAGETIADLTVGVIEGAAITWYTLADNVYTQVPDTDLLVNSTTYYVSQTVNNCESAKYAITASLVAATDTFSLAGLKAYPNPANEVITITNRTELA